jgi:hypothetical protein
MAAALKLRSLPHRRWAPTWPKCCAASAPAYLRDHSLSTPQARAWRAIVACRTPALGGQLQRCDRCGQEQRLFRSCRNRHCPQCQHHARDAWRRARLAELLPVPYCHLVFTLPHALNGLAQFHDRWVYRTLMQCVAATLSEFAANPRWLGAPPAPSPWCCTPGRRTCAATSTCTH